MVAPAVAAAGIQAGARLLSGLFGKKSSTQTSRVDYKQMVKDAEAAGFNPTAVLRNGGAAGYTNTTLPSLTTGEILADALNTGVGTYYAAKGSEIDRELEQVELDIAREELAQIQNQGNLDTSQYFGYGIPQAHNRSGYDDTQSSNPSLDVDFRSDRDLSTVGGTFDVDERTDTADKVSQEYGDIVEGIWGIGKLGWDFGRNVGAGVRLAARGHYNDRFDNPFGLPEPEYPERDYPDYSAPDITGQNFQEIWGFN